MNIHKNDTRMRLIFKKRVGLFFMLKDLLPYLLIIMYHERSFKETGRFYLEISGNQFLKRLTYAWPDDNMSITEKTGNGAEK